MNRVVLVQLPIPQNTLGAKTGNIPLAAAWLARAAGDVEGVSVEILPEALPAVAFSDLDLQNRWLTLTSAGQVAEKIRRYCAA